jgi:hypothetical protein
VGCQETERTRFALEADAQVLATGDVDVTVGGVVDGQHRLGDEAAGPGDEVAQVDRIG